MIATTTPISTVTDMREARKAANAAAFHAAMDAYLELEDAAAEIPQRQYEIIARVRLLYPEFSNRDIAAALGWRDDVTAHRRIKRAMENSQHILAEEFAATR